MAAIAAQSPTRKPQSIILTTLFVLVIPALGIPAAIATILLGTVQGHHLAMFGLGFLLTGFGITVGYHRLLTHRSFETSGPVKATLLILGSMAVEGPANDWAANHMKHHTFSDREGDPHSPRQGFLHSHWGWLSEFSSIESGKYAAWVYRDPIASAITRTFPVWVTLSYVIPLLLGGWEGLIWGGLLRQFAVHNVTFAVNSVCHRWGSQPFVTGDLSRNNWIVGILGLGEGWHNNHHAFPFSAYHGLRWWQIDLSSELIKLLRAAHLVRNVLVPDARQLQLKAAPIEVKS